LPADDGKKRLFAIVLPNIAQSGIARLALALVATAPTTASPCTWQIAGAINASGSGDCYVDLSGPIFYVTIEIGERHTLDVVYAKAVKLDGVAPACEFDVTSMAIETHRWELAAN
jgi:hypothetical protein